MIKSVEDKGYKTITKLKFDDGVWKVEVHKPNGKEWISRSTRQRRDP